ncbi:Bug family tripartite tricarboxylate transporter substrate binding protein [Achromobacter aloeverae]
MIDLPRRRLLAAAALAAVTPLARARAGFPDRPPRLIVGFAPGGGSDFIARALAAEIAGPLGRPLIVENRPGAGGAIAARAAASSPPDGYTLFLGSAATFVINPALMTNLPYDAEKDFVPVGSVARFDYVLMTRPDLPYKTMADLIAHAKQKPGELTIGSAGNGSNTHLAAAAFQQAAGIRLRHIPYKGTTPALTDLAGGNIDLLFDSVPTVLSLVKSGKVKGLATTGSTREALLPDLPTVMEAGVPSFTASNWFAVFAPARTPPEIVTAINAAMQEALGGEALRAQLTSTGNVPLPGSPQDLQTLVNEERASYRKLIQSSGIKIE